MASCASEGGASGQKTCERMSGRVGGLGVTGRVVWGIGLDGVFGKSVEREGFVATCLGVGRTLGNSFVSFFRFTCALLLLFSFYPDFSLGTAIARPCF